jgi:hypothetical protein
MMFSLGNDDSENGQSYSEQANVYIWNSVDYATVLCLWSSTSSNSGLGPPPFPGDCRTTQRGSIESSSHQP